MERQFTRKTLIGGIWIRQPLRYFYLRRAELSTVMPWLPYPDVTLSSIENSDPGYGKKLWLSADLIAIPTG